MGINLDEQREWYEDWHASSRSELPVEQLKQNMRLFAIDRVLRQIDYTQPLVIGCGQGDELRLLNAASIIAFDLSRNAVENAREIVPTSHYLQADGMHLPFRDGAFDLVISSEVIEHILEPQQMLVEVARVLRPGGMLILTTPNWRSFFGLARWAGETLFHRSFTSDDQPVDRWSTVSSLAAMLGAAGFEVTGQRGAWYYPPTGIGMRRLPDRLMANLFKRLLSVERWLQHTRPGMGHILIVAAQLTRPNRR